MTIPVPVDVLFVLCSEAGEPEDAIAVGQKLEARGLRVCYLCERRRAAENVWRAGLPGFFIGDLYRDVSPASRDIADRLFAGRLREIIWPELQYLYWAENEQVEGRLLEKARRYSAAVVELLGELRPTMVIQNQGAEILRRIVEDVSWDLGISNLYLGWAPFAAKVGVYHNYMGDWISRGGTETAFDPEDYRRTVLSRKPVLVNPHREPLWQKARRYAQRLHHEQFGERDSDYHRTPVQDIRFGLQLRSRTFAARLFYQQLPDGPFVYFPMHVRNDSQVTVRAYAYWRQKFVIDLIARSVPEGFSLVVKEHPAGAGRTPLGDLRFIASLPRVHLVPPDVNSHEILEQAAAVVVLNSTVGFEALLHRCPTVVLGQAFYSRRGITVDIRDPLRMRDALREALAVGELALPDVNRVVRDLYAGSWPGAMFGRGLTDPTADTLQRLWEIVRTEGTGALRKNSASLEGAKDSLLGSAV